MSVEGNESKIIDGRALAKKVEADVKLGVEALQKEQGITPGLATILVGEDPASKMYVRLKHKACDRVGIKAEDHFLPTEVSQEELLGLIASLNQNEAVH
ncbi:MAG: tetrahydrofolate dehydrogenase/cyclohydrolase catalytic domain-containing protein, partial [Methanosarcinaceae archaeon]|nr:tetrahydrofolate dehydrogenase/cyclohydrolase catalytic domain-containing protein [Methanosarcinaceae archaeon]